MEHFTNRELTRLEKYMCDNFPEDITSGKLLRLHQHSDNASQHFKNTGAMNYFSTIINERGGPSLTAYVYTFGAPGHGKGPYDGIGGRWKQKIDKVIESSMTQETLSYTSSGYVQSVTDVFHTLVHHFGSDTNQVRDRQMAGRNPIHHYDFFLYTFDNDPILRPEESFDRLEGISSHYQFAVNNDSILFML